MSGPRMPTEPAAPGGGPVSHPGPFPGRLVIGAGVFRVQVVPPPPDWVYYQGPCPQGHGDAWWWSRRHPSGDGGCRTSVGVSCPLCGSGEL